MIVNYAFAFYPLYIEDYYKEISSFETGIFLSIPDFAILIFGIPIGELVIKAGRKTAIRVSTTTLLVSSTILAFLTLEQ
jgi:MFS family permease